MNWLLGQCKSWNSLFVIIQERILECNKKAPRWSGEYRQKRATSTLIELGLFLTYHSGSQMRSKWEIWQCYRFSRHYVSEIQKQIKAVEVTCNGFEQSPITTVAWLLKSYQACISLWNEAGHLNCFVKCCTRVLRRNLFWHLVV